MGRSVPIDNLSLIHPIIYLSILAAGFAASMAIITSLCSVGFRRKTSTPPPSTDPIETSNELDATPSPNTETKNEEDDNKDKDNSNDNEEVKELPLPPALQQHPKDPFLSERMKRVTSERKLPLSLSIKMPRTLSVARNWEQKEDKNKGNIAGKLKAEDNVWMKTIILGEKCVPDEEGDPVIFEGKGKRIAAYHTKRHSTMSISRQTSFLDSDALPLSVPQSRTQDQTTSCT